MSAPSLLRVEGLSCAIGATRLLSGITFALAPGERVGLFGPSGAGKSLVLRALVGLAPRETSLSGTMTWRDEPRREFSRPSAFASLRGRSIALVPQDAAASLDPIRPLGEQLAELVEIHRSGSNAVALLERVALAPELARMRPAELSGGMAQRVAIAAALACDPALLLADEPTSALDNLSQAHVLDALDLACEQSGAALLLVSHDRALLTERCTRLLMLERGELVADAMEIPV